MKHSLALTALRNFALAASLCASSSASVIVVDAGGGGAFTQISAAVAAATDGDVILVKTGSYVGFSIANKALDVVADSGASVTVNGSVSVQALASTRTVSLGGLAIRPAPGPEEAALRLAANSGSIRVQGCEILGYSPRDCVDQLIGGGTAVRIFGCSDVAFASCTLSGGDAPLYFGNYGEAGGEGLHSDSASVAFYDCTVRGGKGGSFSTTCGSCCGGYAGSGLSAAFAIRTPVLFASNSTFRGGDAGFVAPGLGQDGCPAPGLFVQSMTPFTNAVSLQSTFIHGATSTGCTFPITDVMFAPPDTFTTLGGSPRRMTATRAPREGQPARLDFFGSPGEQVLLTFAEAGRFTYLPAQRGVQLVRTRAPTPVQIVGTIGAGGTLSSAWIVPELGAGVEARRFLLQAQFIDASGQATLGPPSTMVLVDSAF